MSCILYYETRVWNVVVLQVNQMKDKIAAKEQHIADLQKKAQVISCPDFWRILLLSFAPLLFESATAWPSLGWVLKSHETIFPVKLQKLEDELVAARKVSSERQLAVTDVCALHLLAAYLWKPVSVALQLFVWRNHCMQLYKHFLQLQDYNDRVKTAEQKLQVIFSTFCFSFIPCMYIHVTMKSTSVAQTLHWPIWCCICMTNSLFRTSLLSALQWLSLTWLKMLQPGMVRCTRMAWFEHRADCLGY